MVKLKLIGLGKMQSCNFIKEKPGPRSGFVFPTSSRKRGDALQAALAISLTVAAFAEATVVSIVALACLADWAIVS